MQERLLMAHIASNGLDSLAWSGRLRSMCGVDRVWFEWMMRDDGGCENVDFKAK